MDLVRETGDTKGIIRCGSHLGQVHGLAKLESVHVIRDVVREEVEQ
jgi:hypothetical protein